MRLLVTGPTAELGERGREELTYLLIEQAGMTDEDRLYPEKWGHVTLLHSGRPGVEAAANKIAKELGWEVERWDFGVDAYEDAAPDQALIIWDGWPMRDVHEAIADAGVRVVTEYLGR